MEQPNTFQDMDAMLPQRPAAQESHAARGEISVEDFSDVAVGDQVKYNRPDLNNKTDVVARFQVFMPDINKDQPVQARDNKNVEYWKVNMILTYESKNQDGVQNREYISGARCFRQRDGTASAPSIWYEAHDTQAGYLWDLVAKALGKPSKDMSPREFVAFLNSKPKVRIEAKEYKNFNAPAGAPKSIRKNMPAEFMRA